jgi:chaperonin GroES
MTKLEPMDDRLIIKRIDAVEETRGGIIIPDNAREKSQEAEVVATGPGKLLDNGIRAPINIKVGARILLGKYAGTEVKIDDVEYVIIRADDVLAVVERTKGRSA